MIGLIFINDLNVCPYIDKYIDSLKKNRQKFEIIIWDRTYRSDKQYKFKCDHILKMPASEDENYIKKLYHFKKYSKFVKEIIKKQKYNKLVLLSTLSAFMCYKELVTQYRQKYIFDYRDASYERISFFSKRLKNIIQNSNFTAISSEGFKSILPKYDYSIAHNFNYNDLGKAISENRIKNITDKLTLSFIGVLREFEYNKKLIDIFGDDNRFNLEFHGSGESLEQTSEYASHFNNVTVTGRYNIDEKFIFNLNADMLLYNYPCSYNRNCALANKYYDGLIFKKPLIGNSETFSGKLIMEKGVGISIPFSLNSEEYKTEIYNYYFNLNFDLFLENANIELKRVKDEDEKYISKIEEFIKL